MIMTTTPTTISGLTLEIGEPTELVKWIEAREILARLNQEGPHLHELAWRAPTSQEAQLIHSKLGLRSESYWTLNEKNTTSSIFVFYPNQENSTRKLDRNNLCTLLPVRLR